MRRLLVALTLVAGVTASAASASAAAHLTAAGPYPPGLGIRLVDAPVSLENDPRAHEYIIDRLTPGAEIQRRVAISDGTSSNLTASAYAGGARIANGKFIPLAGHTQNELSSWVSVTPGAFELAPESEQYAYVTVKVPTDAAPGERYGVVWAQTTIPPANPGGVRQIARVGIRLYLSIGQGNAPASNFKILSMTGYRDADSLPIVRAQVHNTGGRALDLTGTLTMVDQLDGLTAGPFPVKLGTTLGIGQTEPVTIVLGKQIPDGPWKATLTLQSDLVKRTATATITFPAGPGQGKTATASAPGSGGLGLVWWLLLLIVLLALIGLLWYALWRRRHRDDEGGAHAA